jgi:hypothetical protein
MTGNVAAANVLVGYELWAVRRFPNDNLIAAYNKGFQVMGVQSPGIDHWYRNPRLICQVGSPRSIGIHASYSYTGSFQIAGGQIAGCDTGIDGGGGVEGLNLSEVVLQNVTNVNGLPQSARFENVQHVPLGNNPHRYIVLWDGNAGIRVWHPTDPLPKIGISTWISQRGSRLVVKNWQQTGQDYLLFYRQQLGSNPAWYSGPYQHTFNTPVQGLTMLQSWEQFGLSYGGDVLKDSEAVQVDGLVGGYGRAGLSVAYSPPRAIVTYPTMREPAHPSATGRVAINAILTGDPNAASDVMMASVDGEPPHNVPGNGQEGRSDARVFGTTHISPGIHTVKVWRTEKGSMTLLPGSEYTAQYFVEPTASVTSTK